MLAVRDHLSEAPIHDAKPGAALVRAFPGLADLPNWLGEPESRRKLVRSFPELDLILEPDRPKATPTYIPPYLTKRGPKALGHTGFHSLRYHNTDNTTFAFVHEAVQPVAPGP